MRIKPHRLLFAALLAPAFVSPAVVAQDAPESTPPNALTGREVIEKAGENARLLGWELGIDLQKPQRIEIEQSDGTTKAYWYVIYTITNANTTVVDGEKVGLPVSTDLSFFVEAISGSDDLNEPNASSPDNSLMKTIQLEVIRQRYGKKLDLSKRGDVDEYERLIQEKVVKEISEIKYRDSYQAHGDANNNYVLQKIAERETGLTLYNPITKRSEIILQPASAFAHHMGLVYDLQSQSETYYSGVRAVPRRVTVPPAVDVELPSVSHIYPGVDGEGAFTRWFTQDELEITAAAAKSGELNHAGVTVVVGPNSRWFGKLLKSRYLENAVVASNGRPLAVNEPGYLQALQDFGVTQKAGEIVTVAKTRFYQEGDKVLNGFDTGVKRGGAGGLNHMVYGRILDNADLFAEDVAARLRADEERLRRGPDKDAEIDGILGRASNGFDAITQLDSDTQFFGRDVVGQPVKVLDRYGRAVARELVLYAPGDRVTNEEYDIWAKRMGVMTKYADSGLDSRPLSFDDFMVNRPKIRMGKANDADSLKADLVTGRRYLPADVDAETFQRDADGTYFSFRIAPVDGANVENSAGEFYPFAPLGNAAAGALPVPTFDAFGAWQDWAGSDGRPVAILDANGNPLKDAFGIVQNLKSYEYEWRYSFQNAPVVDDMAHDRDRDSGAYTARTIFKPADQTVAAWTNANGDFAGLALRKVYAVKKGDDDSYSDVIEVAKVIDESDFDETAFLSGFNKGDAKDSVFFGYSFLTVAPNEELVVGAKAPAPYSPEGLELVEDFTLTQHLYDSIVLRFKENKVLPNVSINSSKTPVNEEKHLMPSPISVSPFGDLDGNPVFKTWDRVTIPAPRVEGDKVLTREEVVLGPGMKEDGSDAPKGLKGLISERVGVLILNDVDDGWDYLNVVVRGLRPSYEGSRFVKKGDSSHFSRELKYQDWAYMERFSKPGDAHNVKRDLISRTRGRWFLLDGDK